MKFPFLFFVILLLFSSCGPSYYYDQTESIPENGWFYDDMKTFEINIEDTLKIYNLYLDLEHDKSFPKQNLYVQIHTSFPGGEQIKEQLSINLMDKTGLWHGDCSGEECDLRVNIQQGAFFNAVGKHKIAIEQFMRIDPVPSIISVSLRIEDTGKVRS